MDKEKVPGWLKGVIASVLLIPLTVVATDIIQSFINSRMPGGEKMSWPWWLHNLWSSASLAVPFAVLFLLWWCFFLRPAQQRTNKKFQQELRAEITALKESLQQELRAEITSFKEGLKQEIVALIPPTPVETEVPAKMWLSREETIRKLEGEFHDFIDEKATDLPLRELEKAQPFSRPIRIKRAEIAGELSLQMLHVLEHKRRSGNLLAWCDDVIKFVEETRNLGSRDVDYVKSIGGLCDEVLAWLKVFLEEVKDARSHFGWDKDEDKAEWPANLPFP
jgi:hypothetical protein